ncbi:MAG: 30S ribosomal protein S6 [Eubacteriales bacterium]
MNKYEVLYVIDALLSEEDIAANISKIEDLVTKNNAKILNVDKWGKKTLAYPINYKTEGYYVLMDFESAPDFPEELQRIMKITEPIIRYMVVAKDDKKE